MKLSCLTKLLLLPALPAAAAAPDAPSVAFYYGSKAPAHLYHHDWLITDPANLAANGAPAGVKSIAYVSFGEVPKDAPAPDKSWLIGENKDWKTAVTDLRSPGWQENLLGRLDALAASYSGFFLDTLDSYQLALPRETWPEYEAAAAAFLDKAKARFPSKLFIANRGFEIVDRASPGTIGAVAAESLFAGINTADMTYKAMKEEDTAWLAGKLQPYAERGLPVIVIDYLPKSRQAEAPALAGRIRKAGFIPFITDLTLSGYGVSDTRPFEREALLVAGNKRDIALSSLHISLQMPVEYLGFDSRLLKESEVYSLPPDYAPACAIIWLEESQAAQPERFRDWVMGLVDRGVKVLFINSFGFEQTAASLARLGLSEAENLSPIGGISVIRSKPPYADYEATLQAGYNATLYRTSARPLVTAVNSAGQEFHPVAAAEWGGYALNYTLTREINGETLLGLNPFELLKEILQVPSFPAPDLTTENGRRLYLSHIDGDGFIEPCEWAPERIAGEELLDSVLKAYDLPVSVSLIEGETSAEGAYPKSAKQAEAAARDTFRLPNIEPASHSFSHPFYWGIKSDTGLYKDYHLQIKDYVFNLDREITGSVSYVNSLAPADKRVKAFFWTGNCLPSEQEIVAVGKAGLLNINGGGAFATRSAPWLSLVPPAYLGRGGVTQVYAPVTNENRYTDKWTFPFYRFMRVLETLELTETPLRLKPAGVYYHYFSASKTASLNALRRIFDKVLTMKLTPVFASEYIERVLDFRKTRLALAPDGAWVVKNDGRLRTLRAPAALGLPDLASSRGLAGYKREKGFSYLHLDGSGDYRLYFSSSPRDLPRIEESSALITSFERRERGFVARLRARSRGEIILAGEAGCLITLNGKKAGKRMELPASGEYELACACK